jgi:serine/threonine protein phosphatase 1
MVERIDDDMRRRPIAQAIEVYLGDYIDRGSHSKDVIDILCRRLVFRNAVCLRGNHEAMLEGFLRNARILHDWAHVGGVATLASYGVPLTSPEDQTVDDLHRALHAVFPRTHTLFLQCLRNMFQCGDYLFVHAGIRPGVPLSEQTQDDLIWIRDEFLSSKKDHGYVVVHGHTPVARIESFSNRINIDTGAVYSGNLTCIALESASILVL